MSELETSVVTTAPSPSSASVGHAPAISLTSTSEWRSFVYENPMTVATTAMLNVNGVGDDPASQSIYYDYYKPLNKQDSLTSEPSHTTEIWSPQHQTLTSNSRGTNGELNEVLLPSSQGSKLQSVLRRGESKGSNKLSSQNGQRYTNGDSLSPSDGPNSNNNPTPIPTSGGVIIVKEEIAHSPGSSSPRMSGILTATPIPAASVSPSDDQHPYTSHTSPQLFATLANPSAHSPYEFGNQNSVVVSSPSQFTQNLMRTQGGIYTVDPGVDSYYRTMSPYFGTEFGAGGVMPMTTKQLSGYDANSEPAFVERYNRPGAYKTTTGLSVDLPSPDSGIGPEAITPRDHSVPQVNGFEYDICHQAMISDIGTNSGRNTPAPQQKSTRPWHDFGRQNEADKIQIPKLFSNYGFRYYLESPISTSQRREDDRITYINKGQFYGITLEYIPDAEKPLKSQTVKTVVMLVFREEKSPEDEIKAWQFWHGRQHSVKQRILDADTKNSVGLVGCIDEIAHNAIAIYWNPLESSAKINVAVQCLSTDFSSQKGVKGLPLHLQIDTYDDPRDPNCPIFHRAYCQIKVFCDKGAERKTRDEERRAAKRKLTATGRKKLDEMYHSPCERSEFYSMSDINKPPVLFTPAEDLDKLTSLELHGFYSTNSEGSDHSGEKKEGVGLDSNGVSNDSVFGSPSTKRMRLIPPASDRIMLFVRQETEDAFTPLHLAPPSTFSLLSALEDKYKISMGSVKNLYRRNGKGIIAKIDDEMLKHYCSEDSFLLEVKASDNDDAFDVTLTELLDCSQ